MRLRQLGTTTGKGSMGSRGSRSSKGMVRLGSKYSEPNRTMPLEQLEQLERLEPSVLPLPPHRNLHHVGLAVFQQRNRAVIDFLAIELGAEHAGPEPIVILDADFIAGLGELPVDLEM